MNPELHLDALRSILRDLALAKPTGLTELAGGSNRVFRIDLADGDAVVLKTYDDLRGKIPAKEAYASGLLARLDLPVTRYLVLDESRARLPFRFAITNHLPGSSVASFKGDPDVADAYRQMGVLLRKLHAVEMPAYGHFTEGGMAKPSYSTNAERTRADLTYHFQQFRTYGAGEALARDLEAVVEARFDTAVHSTGPVFAHDDLNPNNVLAERDGDGSLRLTGLIDFGNAHSADPVWDLAKCLFICAHEAPGSSPAIRQGYGSIDHPDPDGALWFYTLLHRVVMWWWLRHVGVIADGEDHPLIADLRAMARDGLSPQTY